MLPSPLLLFIAILFFFFPIQGQSKVGCEVSDERLIYLKDVLCSSLGEPTEETNVTGLGDWPNQAMYMVDLLAALTGKHTCLDTPVAKDTIEWLDIVDVDQSMWWWTWEVFQVQYYDMPRKEGDRIESPATLGRKCWAFAYLTQVWPELKIDLQNSLESVGYDISPFYDAWDYSINLTMPLCDGVMANCFLNTTYSPDEHNGTCPRSIEQFYVGYQWENGNNNEQLRLDQVIYPFPNYHMTEKWKRDATSSVNTVLNYII